MAFTIGAYGFRILPNPAALPGALARLHERVVRQDTRSKPDLALPMWKSLLVTMITCRADGYQGEASICRLPREAVVWPSVPVVPLSVE